MYQKVQQDTVYTNLFEDFNWPTIRNWRNSAWCWDQFEKSPPNVQSRQHPLKRINNQTAWFLEKM